MFDSSEFRELTNAETRLITGGGQVTDSPFAGYNYNSLSPQEKAILEQSYTIVERDGRPPILKRKKIKDGYPPIHIEEEGGQYIIKNGHASGSNRLSNSHTMNKNYEAAYGKKPDGYQIHHVIPDERVRNNPLAREGYNRGIFDLDRASNLKGLPEEAAQSELIHRGSHPKWNDHVDEVLNNEEEKLLDKYGVDKIEKLPDKAIDKALKSAERKLQKDLVNIQLGLQKGWLKQTPTGIKISENENTEDFETA